MILLINKPLEYTLKLAGLWPFSDHVFGILIVISAALTLLPFQIRMTFFMNADFDLMMGSLSELVPEILIIIKIFILWIHRRLVKLLIDVKSKLTSFKKDV